MGITTETTAVFILNMSAFKVFAVIALIVCVAAESVKEEEAKDQDTAAVHLGAYGGLGYAGLGGLGYGGVGGYGLDYGAGLAGLGYGGLGLGGLGYGYGGLGYGSHGYGQGSSHSFSKTVQASGHQGSGAHGGLHRLGEAVRRA